jgi:DnaK suppressor protein
MRKTKKEAISFPRKLLLPIANFLEAEVKRLTKRKMGIDKDDPFTDESRTTENSLEEDVDEQIGHFSAEVKSSFVNRQIVQLRKALTRIKLGKYGQCESCGKMINTERLAIKPETTICIACEKERNG